MLEINIFRGELSDISAKEQALAVSWYDPAAARVSPSFDMATTVPVLESLSTDLLDVIWVHTPFEESVHIKKKVLLLLTRVLLFLDRASDNPEILS